MNKCWVLKTELAALRSEWAALKFMRVAQKLGEALFGKGYNPHQPRVPAGNPDGGQWTAEGGFSLIRPRTDPERRDGRHHVRVAQLDGPQQYRVDLNEEDDKGGHTKDRHVRKSDEELLADVRNDRRKLLFLDTYRYAKGSFASLESANDLVSRVLAANSAKVDLVSRGGWRFAVIDHQFGFVTGKEAFAVNSRAEPSIRQTTAVRVIIQRDRDSPRGYRAVTAFKKRMNEGN